MAQDPLKYKPRVGLWSQRDPRWALKRLGKSGATMGPKGCAVTCLAFIILRYYYDIENRPEVFYRPGDLVDYMSAHAKFTPQGDAYLNTVDDLTKGKLINVYSPEKARYTMIKLSWGGLDHWVVKLGRDSDDLCFDPYPMPGQPHIVPLTRQTKWRVTDGRRWFKLA